MMNCRNVGAMLGYRCDVSAFDFLKSMCRPSKIDDDRSMCRPSRIDVSTFEDRWSMCRPSKTDDRCEIMLLHLLKTLMVYLYANNCAEGLHFSAFIIYKQ